MAPPDSSSDRWIAIGMVRPLTGSCGLTMTGPFEIDAAPISVQNAGSKALVWGRTSRRPPSVSPWARASHIERVGLA
jgi:hypothetical protein